MVSATPFMDALFTPLLSTAAAKPRALKPYTGSLPPRSQGGCLARPHIMSWTELGTEGGRRRPQLSHELPSRRSALVPYHMCYIVLSVIWLYCHE